MWLSSFCEKRGLGNSRFTNQWRLPFSTLNRHELGRAEMKQAGYINMIGLLSCLLVTSFFMLQILNKYQRNKEIAARAQVFLCAKEHNSLLRSYLKNMARLNKSIMASYLLKHSPIPAVASAAQIAHKASILVQYGVHVSFLKNQLSGQHCSWSQRALWAKSQPYSNGPWLKRFSTGVAKLKEKKWSTKYFPNISSIRPSHYFFLENKFELTSPLSSEIKTSPKEVSLPSSLSSGRPLSLLSVSHY